MIEKTAQSLAEYLDMINEIRKRWNPSPEGEEEIWFRGNSRQSYELLPGIYRQDSVEHGYDELSLFESFKTLAISFMTPRPTCEWEWYFLAQHYRLPTRLLDWTESPLVALFFAIRNRNRKMGHERVTKVVTEQALTELDTLKFDNDPPCVWVLDALSLNALAFGDKGKGVFTPGGERTKYYLPEYALDKRRTKKFNIEGVAQTNQKPIGICPYRANYRMVAQQSTFTLHGTARKPLEKLIRTVGKPLRLACIVLDANKMHDLWKELESAGITRMSLFPEPDSVAERVKLMYL